jgi:hypothetical protein
MRQAPAPNSDDDRSRLPVDALVHLPERFHPGDGNEWLRDLAPDWDSVTVWGTRGWDLGSPPNVVVAHYDSLFGIAFGLATFTVGDVHVEAYGTRESRDAATDELALYLWHRLENGPKDAPPPGTTAEQIPRAFRGRA